MRLWGKWPIEFNVMACFQILRTFVAKRYMLRIRVFLVSFLLRFYSDKWDLAQTLLRYLSQKMTAQFQFFQSLPHKQARKPRSYASPKLRLTHLLTGVKCRATSVAKKEYDSRRKMRCWSVQMRMHPNRPWCTALKQDIVVLNPIPPSILSVW